MAQPSNLADFLGDTSDARTTCAHVSKSGKRCERNPSEGETVCVLHGASLPLAKEAVQRRLVLLQEKSLAVAEELLVLGEDDIRAKVMVAIWDRTGLGPKSTIAVEKAQDASTLSLDELSQEFDRLGQLAREEAHRQRMNEAQLMHVSASDTKH